MARISATNYKLPLRGYSDFRGGWNADAAPDAIADNEMALADDIDLHVRGGFSRRKGYLRLNQNFGAQVKQSIEYCKNDGTIQLLALVGTSLVVMDEDDWTIDKTIQTGVNRDDIPHYFYGDKMLYLDGTDYKVYDGNESRSVQISAPAKAPKLGGVYATAPDLDFEDSGQQGFSPGVYRAFVVFVNASNKTIGVSVEEKVSFYSTGGRYRTLEWSNVPIGPSETAKRRLYRTNSGGSTYYLIDTIDDNTTTTYTDQKYSGGSSAYVTTTGIAGVFKGWVTFIQADGYESDPSPVGATDSLDATAAITWSNIPTGPEGTVARRLYRSKSGGNIGYRLTTINNNTTTTYVDSTADVDLNTAFVLITDSKSDKIKDCDFLLYHPKSGRVFAASKRSADVYYSEQMKLEYFRASVTPTSGDGPVVGMRLFGDALVVMYANSAWVWRGQNPDSDAIWQKLPMPGAFSHYGIIDTPGTMTWIGPGGIYSAPPAILAYGNINVKNEEYSIVNHAEKKIQTIIENTGRKDAVSAVYDSMTSRVYWAYPDGKDSTENTYILVLDWTLKAFTRYTNINAKHLLQRKNGDIIASTNGYLVKLNGAVDDPEDTPVKMNFKSKPYHLDHPFHKKRILRLFTEFKAPETGNVTFTFNIYVDSILVYSRDHVSLGESFVWGESVWGEAIWGGRELIATRSKISASGHRVEVEISCDQLDVEDVIVYGFAFEFRPVRAKGARI